MTRPTLVEFLTARLDEDEAMAQRASDHPDAWGVMANDDYGYLLVQPARVLADVKAKRAIVAECGLAESECATDPMHRCSRYEEHNEAMQDRAILRHLATAYADHPDYDATWAP
jgi:hypothetical protein